MPETGRRRPRVATCEDWDEDAQTTLPDSRTTANVAIRRSDQELIARHRDRASQLDGLDSGYASRAATVTSDSTNSSRRNMPDLRLETAAIPERERKPYLISHAVPAKPVSRRQPASQGEDPGPESRTARVKYEVHKKGTCVICDKFGRHIEVKKEAKASSAVPPPPSPTATRPGILKGVKNDDALINKARRPSSNRPPRPVSMLPNAATPVQFINQAMYGPPAIATPGFTTPATPSMPQYSPLPYQYPSPATLPTPSYPYQPMPPFFDPAILPETRSAQSSRRPSPNRRSAGYGDPVIRHSHNDSGKASLERVSSKENRPPLSSQKSTRSIDPDRVMMPPPPRPHQPEVEFAPRPSLNRRAKTYHALETPTREQLSYDPEPYDEEEINYQPSRAPPASGLVRRESASRPPTSYRAPALVEPRDRPGPRKTVSYSAGTTTTKVATSTSNKMPRRIPVPTLSHEQKEAVAEAYQKRKSQSSNDLTAEALRDLNHRNSSSRSETGSSYSRQSSSKDSSGRGRSQTSGTKTSITLPGGLNMTIPPDYMSKDGRPISMNIGGLIVSVSTESKDAERVKDQKRIERAPSVTSRTSKKSVASSVISNRDNDRGREVSSTSSRRPSHVEDRVPSLKSSRQPSRAPSVNRPSYDYSRRQSADYSKAYDDTVYGA